MKSGFEYAVTVRYGKMKVNCNNSIGQQSYSIIDSRAWMLIVFYCNSAVSTISGVQIDERREHCRMY